jgi:hypothetical protein
MAGVAFGPIGLPAVPHNRYITYYKVVCMRIMLDMWEKGAGRTKRREEASSLQKIPRTWTRLCHPPRSCYIITFHAHFTFSANFNSASDFCVPPHRY